MHYYDGEPADGGGVAMIIMMTLIAAAVLVLVGVAIWVLVRTRSPEPRINTPSRAESTLDERFARGELDETEYHQRMTALRSTRTTDRGR